MFRAVCTVFSSGLATSVVLQYSFLKSTKSNHLTHTSANNDCLAETLTGYSGRCREHILAKMMDTTSHYDLVVIGGGATGCGIALDAATRGLSVALVERNDFSSGSSSKSTKLIHGGVRYLQKAFMDLDREQYHMVKEALSERGILLKIAPHLAYPVPIMLPIYKLWQVPYFWIGIKMYDLVAGRDRLRWSHFISRSNALRMFPMLKSDNLYGAIIYYDGQHNDSRMNITLAITADLNGADVVNHIEVNELLYQESPTDNPDRKKKIAGVRCSDKLTGHSFEIRSEAVVNATGHMTDVVRLMDSPGCSKICQPSSGVHIVLPGYYSPASMGLLDPDTKDGRVVFLLPWENHTIAGTTDRPCEIIDSPVPSDDEVDYILDEIRGYVSSDLEVRRGDVLSAWAGIRPLVLDPNVTDKSNTQALARNHVIEVMPSGLITVAGGKWTTYRQMAEDVVNMVVKTTGIDRSLPCRTKIMKLCGGENWTPISYIKLVQDYGLDSGVAKHLSCTYGDAAEEVIQLCKPTKQRWPLLGRQLHPLFPYVDGEVRYAVKQQARTAIDVIANRTRMAFLNVRAAREALPTVVEIMAKELGWNRRKQQAELDAAFEFLRIDMGWRLRYRFSHHEPIEQSKLEEYERIFATLDRRNHGFIRSKDLRSYIRNSKTLEEDELTYLIKEFDREKQGIVEKADFLQILSVLEEGNVGRRMYKKASEILLKDSSVERSGGGV